MSIMLRMAWLEAKLLLREPMTLVFTLGLPVVMELVMGGVFGNAADAGLYRGVGAMDYYMGAYVGLVIAALGLISLPTHLANYRERGVLRRFDASSIPRWALFGAQALVMVTLASVGAVLVVIVGNIAYDLTAPVSLVLVVLAFLIAALTFAAIGILLGMSMPTARAAQGAGILLWFVMLILGGAGPPPEVLSTGMRAVGSATPLKHVVTLIQDPWLGFGWNAAETGIVVACLIGAVALIAIVTRRQSDR
ncbi:MAG: ABC transporter permease [Actinobacteria bacterium HGW-Actinobacteria-8]|nr:MAG: ABC transporter permease [Actinobacteria bacterium HGW-Actinobacteria-8]